MRISLQRPAGCPPCGSFHFFYCSDSPAVPRMCHCLCRRLVQHLLVLPAVPRLREFSSHWIPGPVLRSPGALFYSQSIVVHWSSTILMSDYRLHDSLCCSLSFRSLLSHLPLHLWSRQSHRHSYLMPTMSSIVLALRAIPAWRLVTLFVLLAVPLAYVSSSRCHPTPVYLASYFRLCKRVFLTPFSSSLHHGFSLVSH